MEKYLYGAAVQGIQSFIFQTNKLKEIVGASELVEEICTSKFAQLLGYKGDYPELKDKLKDDTNCILHAAGNIKYIFSDKSECENIVRTLPKAVTQLAPGITVSQAVVSFNGDDFKTAVNQLEAKLREQRNKPMRSTNIGLMGILRSRRTNNPTVYLDNNDYIDEGTFAKLQYRWHKNNEERTAKKETTRHLAEKAFNIENISPKMIAFDIEDTTEKNDWVAVIHADGNGLGQIVQSIGTDAKKFKDFSERLDEATKNAANRAFDYLNDKDEDGNPFFAPDKVIPIRPIVLGGDDFTVICRASLAIDYVSKFMEYFEDETSKMKDVLGGLDKLTSCAGIAYIKSSYPFYYGYELAETLCSLAKNDAKCKGAKEGDRKLKKNSIAASCLMFHKVEDSFTEEWESIKGRELTPRENVSLQFGPYYINKDWANSYENLTEVRWTVDQLIEKTNKLKGKEGNALKSHLRNWLSITDNGIATQKVKRIKSMLSNKELKDLLIEITDFSDNGPKLIRKEKDTSISHYPVYDMLTLHTINTQITKK